jgi:hemolysin activation/secretion protein
MAGWLRRVVVAAAVLGFPVAAAAQIPSSEQPGRQQQRFVEQPAAKAKASGPIISLPSTGIPTGAAAITLLVNDIRVVGGTAYPAAELKPLYVGLIGHRVPLAAVYDIAQQITAKYGKDGYVLSRAIVPPQNLDPKGAVVTIRVIEGYVDRVEWPPSLERYRDFFSDYTAKITAERPANIKTIMRYLLLAGDLPGIGVSSTFKASTDNSSASTLIVQATEKPLSVDVRIDNRGTEARGPWEFLGSATLNNLFRQHEAFTATYAGALELSELQYAALGYRQVLNSEGLTAFADGSYSWGKPGTAPLIALDFASQSLAADAGLSFPVIRGRDKNLTLSGLVFLSNDEGDILAAPNSIDRLRGLRFKADFDSADSLNGTNQGSVVLSQGIDGLGSTQNGNPLASRANGRVDFSKIEATISRVQPLAQGISVRGALEGQYAFTPLLASEECGYGGKDFGRAFDPSEITGDTCWSASGELRLDLPVAPNPFLSTVQLYTFIDYGSVHRIAPSFGTPTNQNGSSAGVGLRLAEKNNFNADLSAVKPLSGRVDTAWRYFLTASAHY